MHLVPGSLWSFVGLGASDSLVDRSCLGVSLGTVTADSDRGVFVSGCTVGTGLSLEADLGTFAAQVADNLVVDRSVEDED